MSLKQDFSDWASSWDEEETVTKTTPSFDDWEESEEEEEEYQAPRGSYKKKGNQRGRGSNKLTRAEKPNKASYKRSR